MLEVWLKGLQVVLAAGALALLGTTLVPFAASSRPAAEPPASLDVDAGLPLPSDTSLPRYRVIADRNLFKLKEKPVEIPVEIIAESKLQVQLLGTVLAQDSASDDPEQRSLAIVRDTNGEPVTLGVGASFAENRAKLVKIEHRRIVLEHDGRLEAILLEEQLASTPAPGPRRPSTPMVPGIPRGTAAPNMNAVEQLARNMPQTPAGPPTGPDAAMLGVLRQLGSHMVASVERDPNGRVSAFRIQRINEGSPFQGVGLQPGDSIKGINGQSLSAPSAAVQLLSLSAGADARLTLEDANGRSRELVLPGAILQRALTGR